MTAGWTGAYNATERFLLDRAVLGRRDTPWPSVRYRLVWSLADRNGVAALLGEDAAANGDLPPALVPDLERLRRWALRRELLAERVLTAARRGGFRVVFMKSFLDFPYADDDVDAVLDPEATWAGAREALAREGLDYVPSRSTWREPGKTFFVPAGESLRDPETVRVHLHECFGWNGVDAWDRAEVFARASTRRVGRVQVSVPSRRDALAILLAHSGIENKHLYLNDLLQYRGLLAAGAAEDLGAVMADARRVGLDLLCDVVERALAAWDRDVSGGGSDGSSRSGDAEPVLRRRVPLRLPLRSLVRAYARRLSEGVRGGRWDRLPREVAAFGFLDWVLYRRLLRRLDPLAREATAC